MKTLLLPTDKIVFINDITQTMTVRRGSGHFRDYKQYYPPTHYACPEMSSGSFIADHMDLNSLSTIELMDATDDMDILCDTVCQNRCGRPKNVRGELW